MSRGKIQMTSYLLPWRLNTGDQNKISLCSISNAKIISNLRISKLYIIPHLRFDAVACPCWAENDNIFDSTWPQMTSFTIAHDGRGSRHHPSSAADQEWEFQIGIIYVFFFWKWILILNVLYLSLLDDSSLLGQFWQPKDPDKSW